MSTHLAATSLPVHDDDQAIDFSSHALGFNRACAMKPPEARR
jgi:hypothetical protein